jgi:hypothetical protein
MCVYQQKTQWKSFMMSGIEECTSCTLQGLSDRCATSVNTLVCNLYLRLFKSSNLLVKSHLVAGVERPAPALRGRLRRHPLQPCRHRAGPQLGFRGSQAWLGSTAWILQCGDVQPPDWEIGSGWRVKVGQCQVQVQAVTVGTRVTPEP